MKREIKFRAWIDEEKSFADEVSVYHDSSWSAKLRKNGFLIDGYGQEENDCLEQYIGLKDINGVEIYEGDILETEAYNRNKNTMHKPWVVTWAGHSFEHPCCFKDCESGILLCEVIGNIHENPELMEDSQ